MAEIPKIGWRRIYYKGSYIPRIGLYLGEKQEVNNILDEIEFLFLENKNKKIPNNLLKQKIVFYPNCKSKQLANIVPGLIVEKDTNKEKIEEALVFFEKTFRKKLFFSCLNEIASWNDIELLNYLWEYPITGIYFAEKELNLIKPLLVLPPDKPAFIILKDIKNQIFKNLLWFLSSGIGLIFITLNVHKEAFTGIRNIIHFLKKHEKIIGGDPAQERVSVLIPSPTKKKSFTKILKDAENLILASLSLGVAPRICTTSNPLCIDKQDIIFIPSSGFLNKGETGLMLNKAYSGSKIFILGKIEFEEPTPKIITKAESNGELNWGKGKVFFMRENFSSMGFSSLRKFLINIYRDSFINLLEIDVKEGSIFRPWNTSKGWGMFVYIPEQPKIQITLPNQKKVSIGKGSYLFVGDKINSDHIYFFE